MGTKKLQGADGMNFQLQLMRELGMTKPTFYRYKNQIEKGC